ncbi:helix-turn-helix domain-containing protein [Puniceibacterium sp. IMCC21224]|uniref:helix-turn-helix domain-containing protein n=1 Tax=Puniceibacterium sp. IMCC21224 TaxID=1618204 RepID=UPI00064DDA7F|nr:helix-turn-helix domain-containing protein [Puniceibacterium sp. IMCC21224]KMK68550.1 transcriptional regulator, Nlp family [Puniceibacterium sp. IMCC21224]
MAKHDPTRAPKMDWEAIKAQVHRQGMTFTELSKRAGVHKDACGQLKTRPNYDAQTAVAKFIGEKPEDLWPSRYPQKRPRILNINKYTPVDSQKGVRAADRIAAE